MIECKLEANGRFLIRTLLGCLMVTQRLSPGVWMLPAANKINLDSNLGTRLRVIAS